MRRELRPLGVSVSVVQPGAVVTPIWDKMRRSADEILAAAPAHVSQIYRQGFVESLTTSERLVAGSRTTPEDYADAVAAALTAKRPRIRYRVGVDSWGSALARRALPDRMMDALIAVTPAILGTGWPTRTADNQASLQRLRVNHDGQPRRPPSHSRSPSTYETVCPQGQRS